MMPRCLFNDPSRLYHSDAARGIVHSKEPRRFAPGGFARGHSLNKPGRIVLLNGVGSAGKSSIAKALQAITREPFLHVQMDSFLEMLPDASWDHPDGITFETVQDAGKPSVIRLIHNNWIGTSGAGQPAIAAANMSNTSPALQESR